MTTLEERVAQAIAFSLASNTDLPDWLQTPALGRNMLPLGELAAPAVVAVVGEALAESREADTWVDEPLRRALADSEAGLTSDLGDFTQYADGDVDDDAPKVDVRRVRAVAFNAVSPAIEQHNDRAGREGNERWFLPLSLRQDIADAVLAAVAEETGLPLTEVRHG